MRVRLNLATKPLESHRRFLLGSGVLGILAGIVFLVLGAHAYQARKAEQEYRAKLAQIEREMVSLQAERKDLELFFKRPENARLHDRAAFLNTIIDARGFNWTQMFVDLEHLLPGGVHVVSIVPKLVGDHVEVKLVVGATSDDAKLKFLRALENSKELTHVKVEAERVPSGNESSDQAVMELTAWYSRA